MIRGGIGMRRRCNGAPIKWLGGVVLIAIGLGMLLACLIPKCVFLIGMGFVGLGYGSSARTEDADSSIFPYTKKSRSF